MKHSIKISSGSLKRSNIKVPKSALPVKSIVKQSIFNYLGESIKGKTVLDLFAGSGNLGFEAISRGGSYAVFVEEDYNAHKIILENRVNLNVEDKSEVVHSDTLKYIGQSIELFNIVFADPPYDAPNRHFLKTVHLVVDKDGILIYFHKKTKNIKKVENMEHLETRSFGKSSYSVYKKL